MINPNNLKYRYPLLPMTTHVYSIYSRGTGGEVYQKGKKYYELTTAFFENLYS